MTMTADHLQSDDVQSENLQSDDVQSDSVAASSSVGVSIGVRAGLRRLYSSAVVLVFLVAALGTILPASKTATAVERFASPVAKYTGFHQQWGLFSHNPSGIEYGMYAEVVFANGETVTWEPASPAGLNSARKERWRKWSARIGEEDSEQQWAGTASFIAREYESDDVVLVRFVNTWSTVPDPEEPPYPRKRSEMAFYEWDPSTQTGEVLDAWE